MAWVVLFHAYVLPRAPGGQSVNEVSCACLATLADDKGCVVLISVSQMPDPVLGMTN